MGGADQTGSASGRTPPAIELRGISKAFGQVQANKSIDLSAEAGTIHGIIGENGAGKTTLIKHLLGLLKAQEGLQDLMD